ncbi:MAG: signal peptidase I [Clostridia bacterium]|nr:signal peptidase I [Clostridia bacterium]
MTTEKTKNTISKILNISGWVLFGFITLIVLLLLFFGLFSKGSIFGVRAYVVLSDSMKKEFPAGSVVFSSEVNPDDLKVGDIITFTRESDGETVTHKIGKIEFDESSGYDVYYTYGTTTGEYDEDPVYRNFIQGKYSFHLPGLGYFLQFLKSPVGYILLILVPFGALIISQGVTVVRNFKLYQEEGKSEIRSERQRLQDEREETQRLLEELRKMQDQLKSQSEQTQCGDNQTTTSAEPVDETAPVVDEQPSTEQPSAEETTTNRGEVELSTTAESNENTNNEENNG